MRHLSTFRYLLLIDASRVRHPSIIYSASPALMTAKIWRAPTRWTNRHRLRTDSKRIIGGLPTFFWCYGLRRSANLNITVADRIWLNMVRVPNTMLSSSSDPPGASGPTTPDRHDAGCNWIYYYIC
jgi:hypothetical protein